jgi:hypothetical protein
MLDKIYGIYERNVKVLLILIPAILFAVMAYLYIKAG